MVNNDIWKLVKLPRKCKAIGFKWIFKTKNDSQKVKLRGLRQDLWLKASYKRRGLILMKLFLLFPLKNLLELVEHFDLELHLMDIKTAFLNGGLNEEVYM